MERSARRLATLVPALLCVLWSLILTPAASAADPTAAPADRTVQGSPDPSPDRTVQGPASPTPGDPKPNRAPAARTAPASVPAPAPAHRLAPPEPHLAPAAVAGLPAVVEHSVRFPAVPAAPAAVPVDLSLPPRGLLAGDPRRERAPPGGPHVPRDPRGPPSTRHS
ncbi:MULTISPECIES: hypothetical protein [unclassified Streptomyces]|uniref:hypothetical protein n=1 Tax=unclassified Streptomyces TaxID=2593676 RepID=UPI0035D62833